MVFRWLVPCLIATVMIAGCTQDPNVKKQKYLEQGNRYYAQGKHNEAIIQLKNALQIDPSFSPAVQALARAYRAKAWNADALREWRRAVELDPGNVAAHAELAQVYLDFNAWDDALTEAETILASTADSAAGLYIKGAALQGKGQSKQALELLVKAQALRPNTP